MRLEPFHLERYFSLHEFSARFLLSSSDCESLGLRELLGRADDECLELWESLRLGYTESRGLPLLLREIAWMYAGMTPDDVLEVVPAEGILLAMQAVLDPGDHVVCTRPGYQSLYAIAEALGCEVTAWEPHEDEAWRFDPADLRAALRPSTKLIVANFPHNPTGYLPTAAEFEELLAAADAAGAYLFSDEMYRWLEQDPGMRLPSAVERYDRAVSLGGLSKTFSLPGLRVGWLVTRDRGVMERAQELKDYTTICAGAPSEVLAVMGLRDRERIAAANVRLVAENAARVDAFVVARPEWFSWVRPHAGSVALARLSAAEGARAFCDRLVAEAGVMLLPSSVFGYGDAHVRIGLGRRALPDGLAALDAWLGGR